MIFRRIRLRFAVTTPPTHSNRPSNAKSFTQSLWRWIFTASVAYGYFLSSRRHKNDYSHKFSCVIVAALVNYALGALWYWVLFGKAWQRFSGTAQMKVSVLSVILGLAPCS